jgi:SprB repeat/Secretion system C-terminal sorting domain
VSGTTDLLCNGDSNGSIDLTPTGGTGTLSYLWDDANGSTTQDLSGVGAGTYTVLVTDASNCSSSIAYTINEPAAITETGASSDVSCGGAADGSVDITVSGGVAPYTFVWSNGALTEDLAGLSGDLYSVTITDFNGCVLTSIDYDVLENDPIVISGTTQDANCGQADGSIDISIIGGASLGTISWSNSSSTEDLTNIPAGSYIVTVTDTDGCSETMPFNVNSIGGPVVDGTFTDASCASANDGSIDITVTGSGPFTYSWDSGQSTEDLIGLAPWTYTVTVNGSVANCPSFGTYIIDGPAYVATASLSGSTFTADVSGATYQWIDCSSGANIAGETSQSFTATTNGSYAVIVTEGDCSDTTDCMTITGAGVNDHDQFEVVIYPNPSNGIFFMETQESLGYTVYDAMGRIIFQDNFDAGTNKIDLSSESEGVYILQVNVNDSMKVIRLVKSN